MNPESIRALINQAIESANELRSEDQHVSRDANATLFGPDGQLDSMSLVALLLDIEEAFLDRDIEISLSDDRAMSESQSPFRSIKTLEAYISRLLQEG